MNMEELEETDKKFFETMQNELEIKDFEMRLWLKHNEEMLKGLLRLKVT